MKLPISAVFALLLPVVAGAGTISGTVTTEALAPLPGMTVSAYTEEGALQATNVTSSAGKYSLSLPAGAYRLVAYDPAGVYAATFLHLAESFETSNIYQLGSTTTLAFQDAVLRLAGYVVGHITSAGGSPLANMTVAAYNSDGTRRGFTTTDSAGAYTLALPAGTYRVAAYDEAASYATTFFDSTASFDAAAPVAVVATQSLIANMKLPLGAKVAGTVTDRETLAPAARLRVTAWAADGTEAGTTLTGSDGRFAFAVRSGAYRFVVDDPTPVPAYAATYAPNAESFSTATAFDTTAGETLTLNVSVVRGGGFAGNVRDATGQFSPGNVVVSAYNADGTVRAFTTAAGPFTVIVPPGDYRIGVYDPALVYLPQFYSLRSTFSTATVLHVTVGFASLPDFQLEKGARITGHVRSRTSSAALANITVGAYDLAGHVISSATTDASGAYALLLAPAAAKLIAFDPALRYATAYYLGAISFAASQSISPAAGTTLTADFAVADAGVVNGTVIDAATAAPLAKMQILSYDANFNVAAETITDAAGSFHLALATGTYTIAAADPLNRYTGATYPSAVPIAAGQTAGPLHFALRAGEVTETRHRAVRH
jgi:hypothetical protein